MIEKSIKTIGILLLIMMMYSCAMTKCHGGIYCECKEFKSGEHYEGN